MTDISTGTLSAELEKSLQNAPTTHPELLAWVRDVAALTEPDRIYWVDGSEEEYNRLAQELVDAGTFVRLSAHEFPNSYAAFSDPDDVARVEERTFICSQTEEGAGPTNNWRDPVEMKQTLTGLFKGSMRGRTMYIIPFVMGSLKAKNPKMAVEITDSAYVVCSMRIMATIGKDVLAKLDETQGFFVKALHSVGAPLEPGQADVPWPCNPEKYIVQFPRPVKSGPSGRVMAAMHCWARNVMHCVSPRLSVMMRAGWLSTCLSSRSPTLRALPATSPPHSPLPAVKPTLR